jgi:hypothetical protein
MDKMGVAVQVIFPTFFIRYNTNNAEAEWALTTTYNRWLAEKCAPTNGRFNGLRYCRCFDLKKRLRNCDGRKHTAPAPSSSVASTSTGVSPTRTFFQFTKKPAPSTCPYASTPAIRCRTRVGQRLSDHVLLRRVSKLRVAKQFPKTAVWIDRVGSLVDSLYDFPIGSGKSAKGCAVNRLVCPVSMNSNRKLFAPIGYSSPSTPSTTSSLY